MAREDKAYCRSADSPKIYDVPGPAEAGLYKF